MYKKPEYCAACHKQFIDQEVNRVGWVQLQNQYDNWAASHWNQKGDARATVECRECHMPLVDSTDPAAGDSADYNRTDDDTNTAATVSWRRTTSCRCVVASGRRGQARATDRPLAAGPH